MTSTSLPRIPVETHDDTLYSTTVLWACAFCKDLIYLFFSGIKTEVTDLCSQKFKYRVQPCSKSNIRIVLKILQGGRFVCYGLHETESPCNWKAGPATAPHEPLLKSKSKTVAVPIRSLSLTSFSPNL